MRILRFAIPLILLVLSILFFGLRVETQVAKNEPKLESTVKTPSPPMAPMPAGPVPVTTSPIKQYEEVSPQLAKEKRCLSCHQGIEVINEKMAKAWGADKKCEVCHKGNPTAYKKKEAHKDMINNAGDFRMLKETCAQCHDDKGVIRKDIEGLIPGVIKLSKVVSQGERNHVPRMLRSLMSTMAGEIAGMRYLWGAQAGKEAFYGIREVKSLGGVVPKGVEAVKELKELPSSGQDVDRMLRNWCLRCHLWTKGEQRSGLFRSSGCSACHVLYGEDGLSKTGDPTISKVTPGHPLKHEITVKVPVSECMHCHNNEGGRIGLSYVGQVMNHSGLPHGRDGEVRPKHYGVNTIHLKADIHYEKGMSCIDCHPSVELHGDGNLYGRMGYEVGVRCETCHGTLEKYGTLKDSRGKALRNVYQRGSEVILVEKLTGKTHVVPQVAKLAETDALQVAMRIPAHMKEIKDRSRLECYACHSRVAPQYYGYHVRLDDRRMAPVDWLAGIGEGVKAKPSLGLWSGDFLYVRWEDPVLGVNDRGRVSSFLPLYQTFLTRIDGEGKVVSLNQVLKTSRGLPGLGMSPIYPHNVTRQARTCETCHNDPKSLGLGQSFLDPEGLGWPPTIKFSLERMVDEEGNELQDTPYNKARSFTKVEIDRINRTNLCVGCHQDMDNTEFWKGITDVFKFAKTNKAHKDIINRIFRRGTVR